MKPDANHLQQFLSSYFHQDWMLEGEADIDIVNIFIKDANLNEIKHIIEDIDNVISFFDEDEGAVMDYVQMLGSFYYEENMNGIQWLKRLRSFLLTSRDTR